MKRTRRTEATDKVLRWPFLETLNGFYFFFLYFTCNFNVKKYFYFFSLGRKL